MKTTYVWKKRAWHTADPQIVGEALEAVREAGGGKLKPAEVVEEARPKTSDLHPFFTWKNSEAAEKWRVHEARQLINVIAIEAPTEDDEAATAPAFVNVRVADEAGVEQYYQSSSVAVEHVDEFAAAVKDLRRKASGLLRSIEELKTLAAGRGEKDSALIGLAAETLAAFEATLAKIN